MGEVSEVIPSVVTPRGLQSSLSTHTPPAFTPPVFAPHMDTNRSYGVACTPEMHEVITGKLVHLAVGEQKGQKTLSTEVAGDHVVAGDRAMAKAYRRELYTLSTQMNGQGSDSRRDGEITENVKFTDFHDSILRAAKASIVRSSRVLKRTDSMSVISTATGSVACSGVVGVGYDVCDDDDLFSCTDSDTCCEESGDDEYTGGSGDDASSVNSCVDDVYEGGGDAGDVEDDAMSDTGEFSD